MSDHSPVFATFLLRLRHDHLQLKSEYMNRLNEKIEEEDLSNTVQLPQNEYKAQSNLNQLNIRSNSQGNVYLEPQKASLLSIVQHSVASNSTTEANEDDEFDRMDSSERTLYRMLRYSLLPPGPHKIRISDFNLLWGSCERLPAKVKIIFPIPYEVFLMYELIIDDPNLNVQALSGEKFVEFFSEKKEIKPVETPVKPIKVSPSSALDVSAMMKMPPSAIVSEASSIVFTQVANIIASSNGSISSSSGHTTTTSSSPLALPSPTASSHWRKQPSRTGTSAILSTDAFKDVISNLHLIWNGEEPLDKLHVAIEVNLLLRTIEFTSFFEGWHANGILRKW